MGITFLITDITRKGGIERTTALLVNEFDKRGHRVTVVSLYKENAAPFFYIRESVGIEYLNGGYYAESLSLMDRIKAFMKSRNRVWRYFQGKEKTLVIGQGFFIGMLLYLVRQKSPVVICEHFKYALYHPFIRFIRNRVYSSFWKVIVLTEADRQRFARRLNNVEVIPNMLSFTSEKSADVKSHRIISVGRLTYQKGYDILLKAVGDLFVRYPEWELVIYGEGELRESLLAQRDAYGLNEYVLFKGNITDIQHAYLESSVFVMSSRFEGLPMVLIEALGCGLPVVSFDCPEGPATLLADGGGILVEPENPVALNEALQTMMGSEEFRMKCACEGKEIVKKYSPEVIYARWASLWDEWDR